MSVIRLSFVSGSLTQSISCNMKKVHNSDQKDHTKKSHVCHFCIPFKGCDFWLLTPSAFFIPNIDLKGGSCNFVVSYVSSTVEFSSLQFKVAQCYTWVLKKIAKHKKLLNIFSMVYLHFYFNHLR